MRTIVKLNLALLFILLSSKVLLSQNDTIPLSLTKQYFSGDLKNYKSYFAAEIIDQDFDPKKISKKAIINYETLLNTDKKSVIAVSVEERDSYNDSYAFWINENGWKLQAICSLRLPAMLHIMYSECKDLDEQGIMLKYDEILNKTIENDGSLTKEAAIEQIGTLEDFSSSIKTIKLTMAPDKELIEYFKKNHTKFNNLLAKINQDNSDKSKNWKFDNKSVYKTSIQELLISSVSNLENSKIICFVIGGMSENFTGYFYCENPNDLPQMEPKGYIMIRSLGDGWYLYKTT